MCHTSIITCIGVKGEIIINIESERKFIIADPKFFIEQIKEVVSCDHIEQGYLSSTPNTRVRIQGDQAWLTIKAEWVGIDRPEFEYEIPIQDAEYLMTLCKTGVLKTRTVGEYNGNLWEMDEFIIPASPTMVEIENPPEDLELLPISMEEVTGGPRGDNVHIAKLGEEQWRNYMRKYEN